MNIYIELEDERFVHLSGLLSHHFTIVDDIKDAEIVVLGIHKTEFIKEIKNKYVFSFCPMDGCINLSENEDYLKKNAYLTALGCLATLKDNYENIVIYGNGRIAPAESVKKSWIQLSTHVPWDTVCGFLLPTQGANLHPPALETWSCYHWATRKVPPCSF